VRRPPRWALVAGLVAVAIALVTVFGGLPDIEGALRHAGSTLGPYTYALVGTLAFLETGAGIGLIAPGELAVILGVAGASGMPARRFLPATIAAAGLWAVACSLLGYVFWNSLDEAVAIARNGSLAIGALVVIAVGGTVAFKRLRRLAGLRRSSIRHRGSSSSSGRLVR
jgi:membrane protein DedA with SNARE-associated domain